MSVNDFPESPDDSGTSVFQAGGAFEIKAPARQTVPLVFASPHSGAAYPDAFLAQSRLDPLTLRRSEDAFVDELFTGVPDLGAPLISATFPRVYVDVNRESNELDQTMFGDTLPISANTRSPRVAAGLGTIARIVSDGQEIYDKPLMYAEARARIEQCYVPYHRALRGLIESTMRRFGTCLLVDCHSMPSRGEMLDSRDGGRVHLVLGDCWGSSCDRTITDTAERAAKEQGFTVQRNAPYAGGYTTRHYGRPSLGVHAIQLEIDRSLYMDERNIEPSRGFNRTRRQLMALATALSGMAWVEGWTRIAAE